MIKCTSYNKFVVSFRSYGKILTSKILPNKSSLEKYILYYISCDLRFVLSMRDSLLIQASITEH